MSKTKLFRELLHSPSLEFIMEAHNGLSARIVEETGFKGIWASGLSISAALGVRDNNEASWTQVLEVCEFMSDASSIPILLDGDTGYGNFNNMRRLVHKLEQRGVAAVCIEDKLFPKTNSFINGDRQPLADVEEFAGKIKAAKEGQRDPNFSVVARLEAFIAGWGLEEMLRRAEAYYQAGADALLIHSKQSTPDQILEFAAAWDRPCPLVIVPTMYYSTPAEVFEQAGISIVIWANHNLRGAIRAMQETSRQIFEERSLVSVEDNVVPVKEVFRLQNADELAKAESRYLPTNGTTLRGVILAQSRGLEFHELTRDKPKTMIEVGNRPILHRLVEQFRQVGTRDIVVLRGFEKDMVHAPNVEFIDNDDHATTGEAYTLYQARERLTGDLVVSFGDILFRRYTLSNLVQEEGDLVIAVDGAWRGRRAPNGREDYVRSSRPYSLDYREEEVFLEEMNPAIDPEAIDGEWIGLLKATGQGTESLKATLEDLSRSEAFAEMQFYDVFNEMLRQGAKVRILFVAGQWIDVDNLEDLSQAQHF